MWSAANSAWRGCRARGAIWRLPVRVDLLKGAAWARVRTSPRPHRYFLVRRHFVEIITAVARQLPFHLLLSNPPE